MYFNNEFNKSDNKSNSKEDWITVKGNHIKLKDGETAKEATQRFINEQQAKSESEKVTGYKECDPENAVKFIKPSFEITSDRHETIKNFKTWYKENLQGKSVENPLLGKVYFYGSGERETTSKNLYNIENLKYISVVPEIIKTSKDIEKEELKHFKQGVKCAYRINGFIDNDENIKKISIVISEDSKGSRFYTFDIERWGKPISTAVTGRVKVTPTENNTMLYHDNQNVNSFELNLYITETDFRMFEINF